MSTAASTGQAPCWEIWLFGQFSLVSRTGEQVPLPDRKAEAHLAVLVANHELGIGRQSAADIVWPARSPKNLVNLRQGLAVLRRSLG
jgi:DNA-binding SARP family transcriptional activator